MPKHYIVHTLSTMELKGRMKILRIIIWYKFWRIEAKLRNGLRLSHLYLAYLVTTLTTYHHTIYIIDRPNGTIDIEYKLRMIHILKNKCTLYSFTFSLC